MTLRVGCVPYLNAKPLIDGFHEPDCRENVVVEYEVPSTLANRLRDGSLDVGLVSTFELFQNPRLMLLPGISISADGPVKSVRLFSKVPFNRIESVSLDTSSLTSTALIRILLREIHGVGPKFERQSPDLSAMLERHDAALLIGDLRLFESPAEYVMDLGEAWKELTGLPFVYAAWLARKGVEEDALPPLIRARDWGLARLADLTARWSARLNLPLERVEDYFFNVMQYDLDDRKLEALDAFRCLCVKHGLVEANPLQKSAPGHVSFL